MQRLSRDKRCMMIFDKAKTKYNLLLTLLLENANIAKVLLLPVTLEDMIDVL